MVDNNDDDVSVATENDERPREHGPWHQCVPVHLRFFAGRRRGRRHSTHGSGSDSGDSGSRTSRALVHIASSSSKE